VTGWHGQHDNGESALLDDKPVRGHALMAWIVILTVSGGLALLHILRPPPRVAEGGSATRSRLIESQLKQIVGVNELMAGGDQAYEQAWKLVENEPFRVRLKFVPVAAELMKDEKTEKVLSLLAELKETDEGRKASAEDRHLLTLLDKLYRGNARKRFSGILRPDEEQELRDGLGWFGELALAPKEGDQELRREIVEPARQSAFVFFVALLGGCGLGLVALVVLIVLLVLLATGPQRRRFKPGSPYGGIYAETFAVWLVAFVLFQFTSAFVPARSHLLVSMLGFLLSLGAIAWPVYRGVPWQQVKEDIGLNIGKGWLREPASGLLCYFASLPLVLISLLIVYIIMREVTGQQEPTHPILEEIGKGDPWMLVQIFIAASVLAPLVEETFFRGVLYRHLREATKGMGFGGSFLLSALVVSFLFAVVHPQGPLGVPPLMALAFGFSIAREWRASLVPSMIAHALHNALVTLIAINVLRG
jgi:membrane protease YdiL (CAAX protease family)